MGVVEAAEVSEEIRAVLGRVRAALVQVRAALGQVRVPLVQVRVALEATQEALVGHRAALEAVRVKQHRLLLPLARLADIKGRLLGNLLLDLVQRPLEEWLRHSAEHLPHLEGITRRLLGVEKGLGEEEGATRLGLATSLLTNLEGERKREREREREKGRVE